MWQADVFDHLIYFLFDFLGTPPLKTGVEINVLLYSEARKHTRIHYAAMRSILVQIYSHIAFGVRLEQKLRRPGV